MPQNLSDYLSETARNTQKTAESGLDETMDRAIDAIVLALKNGKPLLVCGNGGSMADSLHIAGELAARFLHNRKGLKVMALGSNPATLTAWSNDMAFDGLFAREVEAYGEEGGVLLGISTSGGSANVLKAMAQAKTEGSVMTTIALTGETGGAMGEKADILLAVPVSTTAQVQEMHLPLYHYLCKRVEEAFA